MLYDMVMFSCASFQNLLQDKTELQGNNIYMPSYDPIGSRYNYKIQNIVYQNNSDFYKFFNLNQLWKVSKVGCQQWFSAYRADFVLFSLPKNFCSYLVGLFNVHFHFQFYCYAIVWIIEKFRLKYITLILLQYHVSLKKIHVSTETCRNRKS